MSYNKKRAGGSLPDIVPLTFSPCQKFTDRGFFLLKTKIKQILMILPVVCIMILSMAVPLSSSAYNYSSSYLTSQSQFCDTFSRVTSFSKKTYYFLFQYSASSWGFTAEYCEFNYSNISQIYTRDDGIIVIHGNFLHCTVSSIRNNYENYDSAYNSSDYYIYYDPVNDTLCGYDSLQNYTPDSREGQYPVMITNIYSFPNWYELTGLKDPNSLDVDVTFTPELRGLIDLKPKDADGNTTLKSSFKMTVTNNSAKAIQYSMSIYTAENYRIMNGVQSSTASSNDIVTTTASDSPITTTVASSSSSPPEYASFRYYTDEWVYDTGCESENDFWDDNNSNSYNKGSAWHYVASGQTDEQIFNWSQLNIRDHTSYVVEVKAILTDYDIASLKFTSLIENDRIYTELKQLDRSAVEIVYSSTFQVLDLSDVPYNHDDTSNGIIPWNSHEDTQKAHLSYNAKTDSTTGQTSVKSYDAYSDKNSWYNVQKSQIGKYYRDETFDSVSSDSLGNVSSTISQFFGFVSSCFLFLPSEIYNVFFVGLLAVVIIGIIKAVIR